MTLNKGFRNLKDAESLQNDTIMTKPLLQGEACITDMNIKSHV